MKPASDLEGSDTVPPLSLITSSDVDDIVSSRLPPEEKITELIRMRDRLGEAATDPEFGAATGTWPPDDATGIDR